MKVQFCRCSLFVLALQVFALTTMILSPTAHGDLIVVSSTQSVNTYGSAYYEFQDLTTGQTTSGQDQFDLTDANSVSGEATAGGYSSHGLASVNTTTTSQSISGSSYIEAFAYLYRSTDWGSIYPATYDNNWSGHAESYSEFDTVFTLTTPYLLTLLGSVATGTVGNNYDGWSNSQFSLMGVSLDLEFSGNQDIVVHDLLLQPGSYTMWTATAAIPYPFNVSTPWPGEDDTKWASYNFTASFAPVPEPCTLLLLGLGVTGIGVRRWRKKAA